MAASSSSPILAKLLEFKRSHKLKAIAEDERLPRQYFFAFEKPRVYRQMLGDRAFTVLAKLLEETPDAIRADFIARGGIVAKSSAAPKKRSAA